MMKGGASVRGERTVAELRINSDGQWKGERKGEWGEGGKVGGVRWVRRNGRRQWRKRKKS